MPNEPVTPEEMARWAQLHFYGTFYENHGRWCAHWQANYGHPFTHKRVLEERRPERWEMDAMVEYGDDCSDDPP